MGIAKRSFEPALTSVPAEGDEDSGSSEGAEGPAECSKCMWKKEELGDGKLLLPCAECGAAICSTCVEDTICSSCALPLCRTVEGSAPCGADCMDCSRLVCSNCAVPVYLARDTRKRCLDCAVLRKPVSRSVQELAGALEQDLPQLPPRRKLRRTETMPWTPPNSDTEGPRTPKRARRQNPAIRMLPTPPKLERQSCHASRDAVAASEDVGKPQIQ